MINFKSLSLQNFQCHETIQLGLGQSKLTRIEGRNGAGKSSIFEGLVWTLYGIVPRGSSADSIIKRGAKFTCGEVLLTINNEPYTIRRYRNHPTKKNAVEIDGIEGEFDNTQIAQTVINELVGIDYKLFYKIVFLKQYDQEAFATLTDSNQKDIVENILGTDFFTFMEQHFSEIIKDYDTKCDAIINQKESVNMKLDSVRFDIKTMKETLSSLSTNSQTKKSYTKEIDDEEDKIESFKKLANKAEYELKSTIERYNTICQDIHKLEENRDKCKEESSKLEDYEVKYLTGKQTSLEKGKCDMCERKLAKYVEEKFQREIRNNQTHLNKVKELEQQLVALRSQLVTKEREHDKLQDLISDKKKEIQRHQAEIKAAKENIEMYKRFQKKQKEGGEHEDIQKTRKTLENRITEKERLLESVEERFQHTAQDISKLVLFQKALVVAKTAFSNKGIKNNYMNKYLDFLQTEINKVLISVMPHVAAEISTLKKLKSGEIRRKFSLIFYVDGEETDYYSFSGGERKRIDIAFILAMQRLAEIIGRFKCNVLIFDEVFDQLDSEGMETITEYLSQYDKDQVFIITHTPYITDADEVITVGD